MFKVLIALAILIPGTCAAQPMASSYASRDGRIGTVVIACPSQDGSYTAGPCPISKPNIVTYVAPTASSITTANTAVTVFPAGSVATGCDIVNSGSGVLYIDFTAVAAIGSATSLPLQPGQSFHCPFPPTGALSAIAAQPQPFVAVRY
jgi:hypothetical protein